MGNDRVSKNFTNTCVGLNFFETLHCSFWLAYSVSAMVSFYKNSILNQNSVI